jgi:hypothetical protein
VFSLIEWLKTTHEQCDSVVQELEKKTHGAREKRKFMKDTI